MRRNKGFTMVELLAAITILGILLGVASISVSNIIHSSKVKYYKTLKDNVAEAGRSYFNDHRILLPTERDEYNDVTVQTLIDEKYLKNLKNHNKGNCNADLSKVIATRKSLESYEYKVILNCPGVPAELLDN